MWGGKVEIQVWAACELAQAQATALLFVVSLVCYCYGNVDVEVRADGKPGRIAMQHARQAFPLICLYHARHAGAVINNKWVPSEGPQTLAGELPGPYCRDLDK